VDATGAADCHFCAKLEALPDADVVWHFPHSVALLGAWQFYHGYCVVVARGHAAELSGLSDTIRRGYLEEMCLVARAIERCCRPHKLNYELLGNQVPHLHWHLFARYLDDPDRLRPVWLALAEAERDPEVRRRLETGPQERTITVAGLRQQLQTLDAPRA
jgi:diadenosine tetraphosphate (Ap4A) HIT family hydrolase